MSQQAESAEYYTDQPTLFVPSELTGYSTLRGLQQEVDPREEFSFQPNPAYEQYLKMHKIMLGQGSADLLVDISDRLKNEYMPRYLITAGWAAAEAAIIGEQYSTAGRLELINRSTAYWEQAIANQLELNETEERHLTDFAMPYRAALDIACVPLMRGVVLGRISRETSEEVFLDCLNIAEANNVRLNLAYRNGHVDAVADHTGLGFECNALLALNRLRSQSWFAMPALARADSGYYYGSQSHDLLVVRMKKGEIQNIIPVEVKSRTSLTDRNRYQALLVRGKMHLNLEGRSGHTPDETTESIGAVYRNSATRRQEQVAQKVSDRFIKMLNDYYAGEYLGRVATERVKPYFRDNSLVIARHPGLSKLSQAK